LKAHRVDATQGDIVEALRKVGAFVLDLSGVGGGCPDLFVAFRGYRPAAYCPGHLEVWSWAGFLECKTPGGRLRPGQRHFITECPLPVRVVRSTEEALAVIGAEMSGGS
jgi:hypothetical protein